MKHLKLIAIVISTSVLFSCILQKLPKVVTRLRPICRAENFLPDYVLPCTENSEQTSVSPLCLYYDRPSNREA